MANPTIIQGDVIVYGTFSASDIDYPAASIPGSAISDATSERVEASNVVHQFPVAHSQVNGTDVTAKTEMLHIAKGAGTLAAFSVVVETAPTGGDKAAAVDVQKSTGGGAFATLLTGTVAITTGTTSKTPVAGTPIATPTYAAGDVLRIVVTVSGSTGSQAQGLCAAAILQENPS